MASTSSNRLIPILGAVVVVIVVAVLYRQFSGDRAAAGEPLKTIPTPADAQLPDVAGADNDNPAETLRTVAASNEQLRKDISQVLEQNKTLIAENRRLSAGNAASAAPPATSNPQPAPGAAAPGPRPAASPAEPGKDEAGLDGAVGRAIDRTGAAIDSFATAFQFDAPRSETEASNAAARKTAPYPVGAAGDAADEAEFGQGGYRTLPPMGYSAVVDAPKSGASGAVMTRYVRTSGNDAVNASMMGAAPARPAPAPAAAPKPAPIPFFTIPENSTLVGVTSMTSLIGRVPIDGRVTDPMQFKAVVGRDNLAANGFELPPDLEGMIITGIAIGDMALSCSEGKIRSVTFVFNDGTVRTISQRNGGGGTLNVGSSGGFGASGQDLGFISDEFGNPCITGKFVTNAPAYLADLAMLKGLDVAAQAYADAQRTVNNNLSTGSVTSTITGSSSGYAMAQAASGATDEIVRWMVSRLKNSFDAVITPAGRQLVVHLDKELQIDKMPNARKLVYRQQGARQLARGEHYGLE